MMAVYINQFFDILAYNSLKFLQNNQPGFEQPTLYIL